MEATLMHKVGKAVLVGALALVFTAPSAVRPVAAQNGENSAPAPIAVGDRVYCGGFVSESQVKPEMLIVGSVNAAARELYVNGERVYLSKGSADGVQVGEVFQIVRPSGAFYHPFNTKLKLPSFEKRGNQLGYFNEEIGFLHIITVQEKTATAEITETCSEARLGDSLIKYEKPQLPESRAFVPLNPLAVSNGKTTGQIVLARYAREQLGPSDVVVLDIGQKIGVKVGDYFTIYREADSEHLTKYRDDEVSPKNTEGGSDRYRGNGRSIDRRAVKKEKINKDFPAKILPRTVVGELVVTRVEGNTATAVITRTQSGEVYLGDHVELQ